MCVLCLYCSCVLRVAAPVRRTVRCESQRAGRRRGSRPMMSVIPAKNAHSPDILPSMRLLFYFTERCAAFTIPNFDSFPLAVCRLSSSSLLQLPSFWISRPHLSSSSLFVLSLAETCVAFLSCSRRGEGEEIEREVVCEKRQRAREEKRTSERKKRDALNFRRFSLRCSPSQPLSSETAVLAVVGLVLTISLYVKAAAEEVEESERTLSVKKKKRCSVACSSPPLLFVEQQSTD